ncbi:hypothetical protein AURDEDRAFT_117859 [Auricularia subglabra TFB-10046 SS5]|uniref:Uncharacterized protein n=1 Tax=Auricularia subglabra (strain TFB-10046 / SS5) TaxID=717982 RepID=J0CT91_AURST|nr:hypothetical protein AURDEDRAFT_117859 [Auricularia subglabra TFB-10046 SS5]
MVLGVDNPLESHPSAAGQRFTSRCDISGPPRRILDAADAAGQTTKPPPAESLRRAAASLSRRWGDGGAAEIA